MRAPTSRVLVAALIALLSAGTLRAEDPDGKGIGARLARAVTYREHQDRAKRDPAGRLMQAQSGSHGIDINSRLSIEFDKQVIARALAELLDASGDDPELTTLIQLVQELQQTADGIGDLAQAAREVMVAFDSEQVSVGEYEAALGRMGAAATRIITGLGKAAKHRHLRELTANPIPGESDADRDARANKASREVTNEILRARRQRGEQGYPADLFQRAFAEEIRYLDDEIARLVLSRQGAIAVELRGHIIRKGGAAAVPLPGHNLEDAAPARRFKKIELELSEQEQKVYEQAELLAEKIGNTKSIGEAVRRLIEVAVEDLKNQVQAVRAAFDTARGSLDALAEWADADELAEWIRTVPDSIEIPAALGTALENLRQEVQGLRGAVDGIRSVGDLESRLAGSTPTAALELIRSTVNTISGGAETLISGDDWDRRLARARELRNAVREAGLVGRLAEIEGPVKAAFELGGALGNLKAEADALAKRVGGIPDAAFARSGRAADAAATLPEPKGQRRVPLNEELDTVLNLQTIPGNRDKDDQIKLDYRFFVDDTKVAGWEDWFQIEIYGWQVRPLAAVALARQETSSADRDWKPAPTVNLIASWERWPRMFRKKQPGDAELVNLSPKKQAKLKRQDTGLRGVKKIGFGIAMMPLDFDDEEDVELGIAATLSFYKDIVQFGYGENLNADQDKNFVFFSIRLLQFQGFLNPGKGGAAE
jgi:hypothetical protein